MNRLILVLKSSHEPVLNYLFLAIEWLLNGVRPIHSNSGQAHLYH